MGAQLSNRATKPTTRTLPGERFRPVAEDVLRHLYQGREEARRIGDVSANTIRFAATHSLSLNFFPGWLRSLELRSHTFHTRLDTSQFHDCIHLLQRGDCHFLISYTHPDIAMHLSFEHFVSKLVLRDELVPVTWPDSAGRVVDQMISAAPEPLHLRRVFVSHMAAVLKAMSSEGRGTAWLPASHLTREFADGSLVPAGDERWNIPVEVRLIRSRDPLPEVSEELWALIPTEEDTSWG